MPHQVAEDTGFLPLALAIVGSTDTVKDDPMCTVVWLKLHEKLRNKARMLRLKGQRQGSLHSVLDVSYDELGQEQQRNFIKLAVLAHDAIAPLEMLRNLWDKEVGHGVQFDMRRQQHVRVVGKPLTIMF